MCISTRFMADDALRMWPPDIGMLFLFMLDPLPVLMFLNVWLKLFYSRISKYSVMRLLGITSINLKSMFSGPSNLECNFRTFFQQCGTEEVVAQPGERRGQCAGGQMMRSRVRWASADVLAVSGISSQIPLLPRWGLSGVLPPCLSNRRLDDSSFFLLHWVTYLH